MQQQQTKTGMSLGIKLFLASFIVMFITLIFLVIFAITVKFQAEKIENQLEASYQNMQNVYSSVEKILISSGITVKNFGETKINAIKEYVKQHANNPELMMKWVQENPQQIDSKIWENFQKQIEIQYTKFEMEQKNKISISQAYKDFLETSIKGQVAQIIWSFPSKEAQKMMEQVIQTENTKDVFSTGIDKVKNVLE